MEDTTENIHTDFLSKCCKAPYESICADEGTCHAECTKCGEACDLIFTEKQSWEEQIDSLFSKESGLPLDERIKTYTEPYKVLFHDLLHQKAEEVRGMRMDRYWIGQVFDVDNPTTYAENEMQTFNTALEAAASLLEKDLLDKQ